MTFESIIPFFAGEGNFFHKIFKLSDETGRGGCVGAAGGCDAGELLRRQGTRKESIEELSKEYRKQIDFVKWQIDKYQETIREMASQTDQTEEHERKLAR